MSKQKNTNNSALFQLEDFLPYNLRSLASQISIVGQSTILENYGLPISEWRVMITIYGIPGISGAEISDRLGVDKPAISRGISKLIAKGFVKKVINEADQRKQSLALTADGQSVCKTIIPDALEFESKMTECLSATEIKNLKRYLMQIHQKLMDF